MRTTFLLGAAVACALAAGCEDRRTDNGAARGNTAPGATITYTVPAVPTQTLVVRDEDIPVEADFEEQAEKEITPANLETELASLEKQIQADIDQLGGAVR